MTKNENGYLHDEHGFYHCNAQRHCHDNIDMSKMDMPKMDMSKMNMGDQNEITLNYDMLWAAASKDYVVYEFQSVDTSYLHKINLLAARNLQPMIHPKLF